MMEDLMQTCISEEHSDLIEEITSFARAATSESDRAVIMEVFTRVGDNYNDGIIELEASLVETLGESGMQITTPKRQPFVDAMSAVYEEYDTVWGAGVYSRLAAIK